MKGAGGDKQDMVGPYRSVLCSYSSTLYYRQEVSLNTFTGYIGPLALLPACYLLYLFLCEDIDCIPDLDLSFPAFSRKDAAEHLFEVHLKVFHTYIGYYPYRHHLLFYIKLDLPVIKLAFF